jgi:hypothetical protein
MSKKRRIGIYWGVNSIGAVAVEGKKVISSAKFDLSSLEEEAKAEILNEEIRWEALINKTLREINVEGREIFVSVSDKDFIFRSFEMPLMKKKEIKSSIVYEIEKYIPFKIEELMWDFGAVNFPREKKVNISFLGMREDVFRRIQAIFTRLGLKPMVIEPASLSMVRILKSLKQFARLKNFVLLDLNDSEGYLTFYSYELPVFNRYFPTPKKEGRINIEKFIESILLSFQYFKREFKSYELDKFVVISEIPVDNLIPALKEEISTEIELITPSELIAGLSHIETIKALSVANRDGYSYKFKPIFLKTEEHIEEGVIPKGVHLNLTLLGLVIGIGIVVSIFSSVYLGNKLAIEKIRLKKEEEKLVIPPSLKSLSWGRIEEIIIGKERKVRELRKIQKSFKKIAVFLEKIPSLRPKGLWLESLSLNLKDNKYEGELKGYVFLADGYKEREGINELILDLRREESIKEIFSDIELSSSQRVDMKGFEVTSFVIKLR